MLYLVCKNGLFDSLQVSLGPCGCIYDNQFMTLNYNYLMHNWSDLNRNSKNILYVTQKYLEAGTHMNSVKLLLALSIRKYKDLKLLFALCNTFA